MAQFDVFPPLGAATDVQELGQPLGSAAEHRYTILSALDVLLTGI